MTSFQNDLLSAPLRSVVPRSRFLGDTGVPLPEFQRDINKFWGTHQIHHIFTFKLNSYPKISVYILGVGITSENRIVIYRDFRVRIEIRITIYHKP